jgi:hypothetical protein
MPGRIPGTRVFFGDIFPGFFLDGNIPGTIPGKMPRLQSATVVSQIIESVYDKVSKWPGKPVWD